MLLLNGYGQHINQYNVEVGGLGSSAQTPFWLRANQYGIVPLNNPVSTIKCKS